MRSVFSSPHDAFYRVHVSRCEADLLAQWDVWGRNADVTPFQSYRWLATWYATTGRTVGQPLLVTVLDQSDENLVAMLPLVVRAEAGLRKIEFADGGVSDYNAPALGPSAPTDRVGAQRLWSTIISAIPEADFLRFERMPRDIKGRVNPLTLLPNARESEKTSNIVDISGNWTDYTNRLESSFRRELGRSWRVFSRNDGAVFRQIDAGIEASAVLAELEHQQADRLRRKGLTYRLDRPELAAFYRKLVVDGICEGSVVLTALCCGDEIVAAVLSIVDSETCVFLRVCSGTEEWSNCSPGRLVMARTMEMLHGRGYKFFDFAIGDYDYKRRLGVSNQPLFNLTTAMSARGLPVLAMDRTKKFIRRRPALHALVKRYTAKSS